ncbi:zinc-binding dehydrogenase, partial [Mycobacterium sp. NPDC003449]
EGALDMEELAVKRLEIVGVTFRTRTPDEKAAIVASLTADLGTRLGTDELKPRIDRVASWLEVLDVHRSVSDDAHLGKIVLQVS